MDFDWQDMAAVGALAEEISEQEREKIRLEQEMEPHYQPDEIEANPDEIDPEDLIP